MSQKTTVYDLGRVTLDPPPEAPRRVEKPHAFQPRGQQKPANPHLRQTPRFRAVPLQRVPRRRAARPAISASASLLIPGLGQLIAREPGAGLFFLTGMGFCAAMFWAIVSSMDRIVATLDLFGVPAIAPILVADAVYVVAAILHVEAVLHADLLDYEYGDRSLPHPFVAGLASFLVPGWGQILASHRRRATLFLVATWLTAGVWLCLTPAATETLAAAGLELPSELTSTLAVVLLAVLSVVIWGIGVYDAAAGAAMERREAR